MTASGLYIHVPFCPRKCAYCNFYSVTDLHLIPAFLEALFVEMDLCSLEYDFGAFDTVYLGGGSPSVLSAGQIESILTQTHGVFEIDSDPEITMEVNPGDVDAQYLAELKSAGINRLNVGAQSFDDGILRFLGRRHAGGDARRTIEEARAAGFDNVGLDLIYAIPGQDMALWLETLDEALSFHPQHLSCYQLTIEHGTPLGGRFDQGEFRKPGNEEEYRFFMKTSETLENAGYIHYEVSNFAADASTLSRHNQKYWEHSPYIGLGPAAHSFQNNNRWWNFRSVYQYIASSTEGKLPVEGCESLTEEQLQLETLMLALRTRKGIDLEQYRKRFHTDLMKEKDAVIWHLAEEGLIEVSESRIAPTRKGMAVADSLSLI